jgi:peptide/nickel transport system substrate-binding protein
MVNLYRRIRQFKITGKLPEETKINKALSVFSKTERVFFSVFILVLLVSTVVMLQIINKSFMVKVPMHGGQISIGIENSPRFINPILANSDADESLVSLIYSGLMRKDNEGKLIPDLAEKYDISKNGLIYTFTLKDNLTFQDGKPITTDDILFTIEKLKDPIIKSQHKINWDGVNVEVIDKKNIKFILKQPYASFLENFTLGIMPMHIWNGSPIELNNANTNPIGGGPYMVSTIKKQSSGIIDSYELVPFKKFALGEPYIKNISVNFYSNEDSLLKALTEGKVDEISSITPENAEMLKEKGYQVYSPTLGRVFGLFFNQNQNQIFIDKVVVRAIEEAIDKDQIVKEVLFGYGEVINNPIPPNLIPYNSTAKNTTARSELLQKIQNDLAKDGWKKDESGFLEKTTTDKKKKVVKKLEFSISTGNTEELTKTAMLIKKDLADIGIKVDIKTFETGNLNQNVIRPRKYDALLFGEIINHESDLFAFWHSSQRKDPGLNVALYTNAKVDKILEDAFVTIDEASRTKKYILFEDEIKKDMPAIFLYSPDFIYVTSKNLKNFEMKSIISPADRYLNIYSWYLNTEDVWKIFVK